MAGGLGKPTLMLILPGIVNHIPDRAHLEISLHIVQQATC
jgi:hypothetical protein